MVSQILKFIREKQMIQPGDRILAGISGGADSVCLLFVLLRIQEELPFELAAVHVNHGLRGAEADRDEEFVKVLCEREQVPLSVFHCGVRERAEQEKISLEEAGRLCRYEVFAREAERLNCNRIAVAHHADDQAETMLFHLFRGTGIKGLAGMEPVRGNIIRPLLCVERCEITGWLEKNGISWCTDSTNLEETYTRNRIRHSILGCARKEINERAVRHMADTAQELAETEAFLQQETREAVEKCVHREDEGCFIEASTFLKLHSLIGSRVLRECLSLYGGIRDVNRGHIKDLQDLFEKSVGSRISLPGNRIGYREYEGIRIETSLGREKNGSSGEEQEAADTEYSVLFEPGNFTRCLDIDGKTWVFSLENAEKAKLIPQKTYTKWFDYDRIKKCLKIRRRKPGDYLEVNQKRDRKKLNRYLIDEKVPARERERLWLLADGSHIIWVPGGRISEGYKVTENTQRILKVQIKGGFGNG